MKPATFFFALTLILLFTKHSVSSRAIVDDTIVYDSSGDPLQKDSLYIISPPIWGPLGGSVMLGSAHNDIDGKCEADVLQNRFEVGRGTPFTFTPVAVPIGKDVIELGKPVAIQCLPVENPCEGESTVWKVSNRTGFPVSTITTGGIIDTPSSCLRITRPRAPTFPDSYTFEYCPYMCGTGGPKYCRPIGTYERNDQRYLSPNSLSVFEFVLTKAIQPRVISEVV